MRRGGRGFPPGRRCRHRRRRRRRCRCRAPPKWALASMPRASPETTTSPPCPRPAASSRARRRPLADALRAPTIAIIGPGQQLGGAEHAQHRRRVFNLGERRRITGLAPAQEPAAETGEGGEFGLGGRSCRRRDGARPFAAARQLRQGVERGAGRTESPQHRVKADRADPLGAAEPQPVEPLFGIEFARGQGLPQLLCSEIRLSVPAIEPRRCWPDGAG